MSIPTRPCTSAPSQSACTVIVATQPRLASLQCITCVIGMSLLMEKRTMSDMKPKMMQAIEHLDAANSHMNSAMSVLSSVILDLQKGADFITRYRDSLIKTVEETCGYVRQSIES